MFITKEGFWELEDGEFEITSNSIMSTLVAYWLIVKRYSKDDLWKKGLNWYPAVETIKDSVAPREFFNYVYISEMVRDGHMSPPSYYWTRRAEGRLEDWEKSGNCSRCIRCLKNTVGHPTPGNQNGVLQGEHQKNWDGAGRRSITS